MYSVDLLAQALNKYEGSFISVSHDRYFISKTANKIWEIIDYEIKEFKGGYAEYTEWKELMQKREKEKIEETETLAQQALQPKIEAPKPANNLDREQKKELQKLQRQLEKTAAQIDDLTKEKTAVEQEMSSPETYAIPDKFKDLENKYALLNAKISAAEKEYETLFEAIVKLENSAI
jgi:ATP-binding cassette subfamily F protein 3